MPKLIHRLRAELEDGTDFEVSADQRDVAKWETQPFGTPLNQVASRLFTYQRFIAWSAAKRQGLTKLDWPKFDEQCVCVDAIAGEAEADAENPGNPAA